MKIKGFKSTGNGPKSGFSFSPKAGFSGSTGRTQEVSGYTRKLPHHSDTRGRAQVKIGPGGDPPAVGRGPVGHKPVKCYADGGFVAKMRTSPMETGDSSVIKRNSPVTEFDSENGGKGPLRPGFKKGGWIAGAIKHPGALHKTLGVPAGEKISAKKLAKAAHSDNPTTRRRANLAKTLKGFNKADGGMVDGKPCYADGGKVATVGAAIKMLKVLMARGESAESAATKAASRYNVPKSDVQVAAPAAGGGGMAADKQMLAGGGMPMRAAPAIQRAAQSLAGRAAPARVPPPVARPAAPTMANTGYGSFRRGPLVR